MHRDLQSIPEKVKLKVQTDEVPMHYKKTAVLMNHYKQLRSKRIELEEKVPHIINVVRAQKQPEDAFTRCWDPATGVKMKVKDIEQALEDLEAKIIAVKIPEDHEARMKKIYNNMKDRYIGDTSLLAAKVKNIRHTMRHIKGQCRLKETTLCDVEDNIASMGKELVAKHETIEMNRMNYQRTIVELKTKNEEAINMLKIDILGTVRRENVKKDQTEVETQEVQTKLDVRRVETLTARGAKGWLQESTKRRIPTQNAIKRLQEAEMLRDPLELTQHWKGLESRTSEIEKSKIEMDDKIALRTEQLETLQEQEKEASQSIHLFIQKEEEINLWGIQENIEEAARMVSILFFICFGKHHINVRVMY
jgi:hypothetical protein